MTAALTVDRPADVAAALAEAVRRAGRFGPAGQSTPDVAHAHTRPALPVDPTLTALLPHGLRRGASVGVAGGVASTSLTLALVGAAVAAGSWCALVGLPALTAEALTGFGLDLRRVAVVPAAALTGPGTGAPAATARTGAPGGTAGNGSRAGSAWATAVGALVDAVDLVVVRPPARLPDGDVRRLTARARSRGAVLVVVTPGGVGWPGLDVRLAAEHVAWAGLDGAGGPLGHGRLRARQVSVHNHGRPVGGQPNASVPLWLPGPSGGVEPVPAPPAVTAPTPLRRVG